MGDSDTQFGTRKKWLPHKSSVNLSVKEYLSASTGSAGFSMSFQITIT